MLNKDYFYNLDTPFNHMICFLMVVDKDADDQKFINKIKKFNYLSELGPDDQEELIYLLNRYDYLSQFNKEFVPLEELIASIKQMIEEDAVGCGQ